MSFFSKINNFRRQIRDVENSIYSNKQEYLEIYERNQQLEKEISERSEELNLANKRMLTLQHIADMMSSAKPLNTVLQSIVDSIKGDLGYLHSVIIRKNHDDEGDFISIIAEANDIYIERLNQNIKIPLNARRLQYQDNNIYSKSINEKKILQTRDMREALYYILPEVDKKTADTIFRELESKSLNVIPLYIRNKAFGWFCVFSKRDEITSNEMEFLSMFAQQIELAITIANLFEEIREQAVTDGLTGLYNRRYFEEYLKKEVTRSLRTGQPFSIIGLDLDFLKQINDKYGHTFGDLAIKTIADVLKSNARSIDTAARMGGEEFNIVLPGINSEGAMVAAERIRKAIEDTEIDTIGHVTASIGVATFLEHSENIEEIIELTDQAMYLSKHKGRNRVTLAQTVKETSWQEIAVNTFVDILSKHNMPIPQELSDDLCDKLKNNSSQKEILYSVADILTQTYNPLHSQGVIKSKLLTAVSLAKRFDLSKEDVDKLKIAILLYDIGNLMLPKEILQKSTPLTEEEVKKIKTHPIIAAKEILNPISYIQDIIPIIEHHHENWDGSGYPFNLEKESIPLMSQIILIVDAYYALIERRSYRNKLSPQEAIEEIKKDSGKKWNENLVKEFVALIEQDN